MHLCCTNFGFSNSWLLRCIPTVIGYLLLCVFGDIRLIQDTHLLILAASHLVYLLLTLVLRFNFLASNTTFHAVLDAQRHVF